MALLFLYNYLSSLIFKTVIHFGCTESSNSVFVSFSQLCDINTVILYLYISYVKPTLRKIPDNKVHGANMGPVWGRRDPGGPMLAP